MVFLDGIPGLYVNVRVNGRTATQYNNPDENERPELTHDDFHLAVRGQALPYVVKYIEAKPGECFDIRVKRTPQFQRIRKGFFSGWKQMGARTMHAGTTAIQAQQKLVRHLHWLKFANLDIGEVEGLKLEELMKQVKKTKEWGKIIVRCYHSDGQRPGEWSTSRIASDNGNERISEKAVKGKALDAVTRFNSTTTTPRSKKTEYLILSSDAKHRPFAAFEFRHRTKRGLVVEGIIPRTPSPAPEDRVQDMPEDEVRRLARELLARERERDKTPAVKDETKRGIKREIDLTDEDPSQADVPPYKTQRRADGALEIDLTELE
ncbi:hypothetical protein V8F33_013783 [Rhypophila sp. PSN 637]